jgi:hypothetical protein
MVFAVMLLDFETPFGDGFSICNMTREQKSVLKCTRDGYCHLSGRTFIRETWLGCIGFGCEKGFDSFIATVFGVDNLGLLSPDRPFDDWILNLANHWLEYLNFVGIYFPSNYRFACHNTNTLNDD